MLIRDELSVADPLAPGSSSSLRHAAQGLSLIEGKPFKSFKPSNNPASSSNDLNGLNFLTVLSGVHFVVRSYPNASCLLAEW
jgi:hypothetical protein